jgi:hypothetical protein
MEETMREKQREFSLSLAAVALYFGHMFQGGSAPEFELWALTSTLELT